MDQMMMHDKMTGVLPVIPAYSELADNIISMSRAQKQVIDAVFVCLRYRDLSTAKHSYFMGKCSYELALIFDRENAPLYFYGGISHDIGKIAMRDYILKGTHRLSLDERDEIKEHVRVGSAILNELGLPEIIQHIALFHHESYDGSGYLFGLQKEEIPLAGRIAAVSDVFSAIITDRPYTPARSTEDAIRIMIHEKERFDPVIFEKFLEIVDSINLNEFRWS